MERIINVTGGKGGFAFLLLGDTFTALVDTGMAYCAANLINNIKHTLNSRRLDYVFITHSHYDHIGAIPFLRKEWPELKVLGSEHAKQILNKPKALSLIKELSMSAASFYDADELEDYDDHLMKVDRSIFEGDVLDLGGFPVKAFDTQGHTQCSLSFLVNDDTLFSSESTGYMSESGRLFPCFLNSFEKAIESIHKCQRINPKTIIVPHYGLLNEHEVPNYWNNCIQAANKSRDFILRLHQEGYNKEQILAEYEIEFQDELSMIEQPITAFRLNSKSMINTVLKEISK